MELEEEIKFWRKNLENTIPENGIISTPEQLNAQNLLALDETYKKLYIEEESKVQKYFSVYQNGYFIPDNIIASENINDNKNASGMYIYIPFRDINNITPTDEEILEYYNNNKHKRSQEKKWKT